METIFTRLEEASRIGDVDSLKKLLQEDEFLLERVIARTSARDNPLHIAAILGHASFAAEIISRKAELAKELNGQGLSPLHLAAAHDQLDVVKELLKGGIHTELCFVRDYKEGLMPLHVAVIKGKTATVRELIETCEAAMNEKAHGGETVLHLAVKSNSLETLEFLISHVDDLNAKDDKGNTMLHLAVSRKQLSVIKLLLSESGLDVNMKNSKGFTPLDVLLESRHQYGDLVIGEMIIAAGGSTATRPQALQPILLYPVSNQGSDKLLYHPGAIKEDAERANPEKNVLETKMNQSPYMLMVVATLVVTISFRAALNPPLPFQPQPNDGTPSPPEIEQLSILSYAQLFLFFDMISLFVSISVILFFLCVVPRKGNTVFNCLLWTLWLATYSNAMAFSFAVPKVFKSVENSPALNALSYGWIAVLMIGMLWVAIRKASCLSRSKSYFQ